MTEITGWVIVNRLDNKPTLFVVFFGIFLIIFNHFYELYQTFPLIHFLTGILGTVSDLQYLTTSAVAEVTAYI